MGEGLVAAAARELAEETGLLADQAASPVPQPVAVLEVAEGPATCRSIISCWSP
ncbi:NUDIX domain-containing protein [Tistrella bauzanensis]